MGQYLDRGFQNEILLTLRQFYPDDYPILNPILELEKRTNYIQNVFYLSEHGLVAAEFYNNSGTFEVTSLRITHKGLDFLEDDGGLSAILGKFTVQFDYDSLKYLVNNSLLERHDLPEDNKTRLRRAMDSASDTAWKELIKTLVQQGISKGPSAIENIAKIFGVN